MNYQKLNELYDLIAYSSDGTFIVTSFIGIERKTGKRVYGTWSDLDSRYHIKPK